MTNLLSRLSCKTRSEAIDMRALRFGYFPRTFVWRDVEYQVEAVERVYTTGSRSLEKIQYFLVRCADGRHTVYRDLSNNMWSIIPG